ncbi:MAG: IS66 family insertion sequence element accessory protein TnpB [Oligoflexales bacterium]|nr:IS66 family insertion sequence element accessory protein TnpB [Oligoflexales bacterium]
MKSISEFSQIFLCKDFVDMRLGINGLSLLVEQQLHLSPFNSQLFVFTNKACNRIKILYWDKSGFALWLKRLEKSRFKWLSQSDESAIKIDSIQLQLLLDGIDLSKLKPHKNLFYKTIL